MLHYGTIQPPLTEAEEATRTAWARRCHVKPHEVPDNVLRYCYLDSNSHSLLTASEQEWIEAVVRAWHQKGDGC